MYTLKTNARRVGSLLAAFGIVIGSFASFVTPAFADALNPLTERSLTLSSSAPGWDSTDGSGNATYAPPNSGANGQKTGNTFQFKVSTDSSASPSDNVKAFTFQYCTAPAGDCTAPGDDTDVHSDAGQPDDVVTRTDDASHSDLNVVASSPSEINNTATPTVDSTGAVTAVPAATSTGNNYIVLTDVGGGSNWTQSTGWNMTVTNNEDGATSPTGKNNYITLTNSAGMGIPAGTAVKIIFFGTNNNYITNPGMGAFFVKINDYTSDTTQDATTLQDGGVTVANVMNLSIEIQTKVLETMSFSVGTVDPDTLSDAQLTTASGLSSHGICNPILTSMDDNPADASSNPQNTLVLGDANAENSLSVDHTYSTHSYFRLSSNASAGATVYYSGDTLSDTEGDQIKPIGATKALPSPGSEQFGLALDNSTAAAVTAAAGTNSDPKYAVNYNEERNATHPELDFESGADNAAAGIVAGTGVDASVASDWSTNTITGKQPSLQVNADDTSLAPTANYGGGTGLINPGTVNTTGYGAGPATAQFAFDATSNQIPVPIANESTKVVDCATGKVRYIANIAATTPAGIYTTKVNYIAAPQY